MTQYILHVSSYAGIVPWAVHFKGRVEGPRTESCHGGTIFNAPDARGQTTCEQGHVIEDKQVKWDVEADWTEARHERWAAAHYNGDGPQQFLTEREVIDRAVVQFLDGSAYPCEEVEPAQEGDELWFGHIDPEVGEVDLDAINDPEDAWGARIAVCHRG